MREHEMRSNPCIIGGKIPFDPNSISGTSERGVSVRRGEKRWKDLRVYIHVIGAFFVFLLLCLSAFFGAVKKSIEQNVRQTITTNAYTLKQGDLISARGEGKFRYVGAEKETKKGRILIRVEKYV